MSHGLITLVTLHHRFLRQNDVDPLGLWEQQEVPNYGRDPAAWFA